MSGIELAGKGEAVKQLREWLDPRYLRVKADAPRVLTDTEAFGSHIQSLFRLRAKLW